MIEQDLTSENEVKPSPEPTEVCDGADPICDPACGRESGTGPAKEWLVDAYPVRSPDGKRASLRVVIESRATRMRYWHWAGPRFDLQLALEVVRKLGGPVRIGTDRGHERIARRRRRS